MGTHIVATDIAHALGPSKAPNHFVKVVRSKLGRPVYMGKCHKVPPFWAFLGLFAYPTLRG